VASVCHSFAHQTVKIMGN